MPFYPEYRFLFAVQETRSGNLILCGSGAGKFTVTDTLGVEGAVIMKLDKWGNRIFYDLYRYDSSRYDRLYDITETSDGGYAAIGEAYHAVGNLNVQAAWLVKVDSNGCLNGDCPTLHTGIEDIADEADRFILFPNPATTRFTIAVTQTDYFKSYKGLVFSLYDLTGREIMTTTLSEQAATYPVADYSPGVYLWQVSEGDRRLSTGKLVVTH
jgi:hypothetical protein